MSAEPRIPYVTIRAALGLASLGEKALGNVFYDL